MSALQLAVQLIVSASLVLASYYRHELGRHLADLLTSTSTPHRRPSPSPRADVVVDPRRRRRDVTAAGNSRRDAGVAAGSSRGDVSAGHPPPRRDNAVVRLYNCRRRQFVAVATRRDDVTAMTSRAARRGRRAPAAGHSVHFSSQPACSSCESVTLSYI